MYGRSADGGCLILDLHLPGKTGLDLPGDLRTQNIPIPVILDSGHVDAAMVKRTADFGAIALLEKPIQFSALPDALLRANRVNRLASPS